MGEANHHGEQLFYLLAKLKGKYQFGFREAEKFLTKEEELELLCDTRCHSTDVNEIQRAMKSNWKFMKYVENYYKKKSGKKLRLNSPIENFFNTLKRHMIELKCPPKNTQTTRIDEVGPPSYCSERDSTNK